MRISEKSKIRRVKRIMKRTRLNKDDAHRFLELLLTNERFKAFKGKKWAFKMAKKQDLTIDEAMKKIMKHREKRAEKDAVSNLVEEDDATLEGGDYEEGGDYDNYEGEEEDDDEDYDDFDAKAYAKKNKTMLIIGGVVLFLFFTKMGKDLVKKIS